MNKKFGFLMAALMSTSLLLGDCQPQRLTQEVIKTVEVEVPREVITTVEVPMEVVTTVEVEKEVKESATLAIEHFSIIEGTTWSGAQDRAGKRIAEKYPNVTYIFRENVAPDKSVPLAQAI